MDTEWARQQLSQYLVWLADAMSLASAEAYRVAEATDERGPKLRLERIAERLADMTALIKAGR